MYDQILTRLLLAAVCGGLVGIEREYRSKSAGFRTMILISIGSCLFTMLSMYIGAGSNPDRIASNIVTGIGFLGAGVIFRGDNRVNGITTAATIWAVAAVGMGVGGGYYWMAAITCTLILIVLALLPYFESIIDRVNQWKSYTIDCDFSYGKRQLYEQLLVKHKLKFRLINQAKKGSELSFTWETRGHAKNHEQFIDEIMNEPSVKLFQY